MSLSIIFLMALVLVLTALTFLWRVIGWKRVLQHATAIDIVFTVVACLMLAGTITGLLIGILAGLVMTAVLTAGKAIQKRLPGYTAPVRSAYKRGKAVLIVNDDDWEPIRGWGEL